MTSTRPTKFLLLLQRATFGGGLASSINSQSLSRPLIYSEIQADLSPSVHPFTSILNSFNVYFSYLVILFWPN